MIASLAFMAAAAPPSPQGLDRFNFRLKGPEIARLIDKALDGTKITLGADVKDDRGRLQPGSFIDFGPSLGRRRFGFSLPSHSVGLGLFGRAIFKPRRIEMRSLDVSATDLEYVLTLAFGSEGTEIKGSHSRLGDAAVPDIDLDNMRLRVRFRPEVREGGKAGFGKLFADLHADMRVDAFTFRIGRRRIDLLNSLTGYQTRLKRAIEDGVVRALESEQVRDMIANRIDDTINGTLRRLGVRLKVAEFRGTDLVATFDRG